MHFVKKGEKKRIITLPKHLSFLYSTKRTLKIKIILLECYCMRSNAILCNNTIKELT